MWRATITKRQQNTEPSQPSPSSSLSFTLFPQPTPSFTPSSTTSEFGSQTSPSSSSFQSSTSSSSLLSSSTDNSLVLTAGAGAGTAAPPLPSATEIRVTTNTIQTYILEGLLGGIVVMLLFVLIAFCFWHRVLVRILASKARRTNNRRSSNTAQVDSASQQERESSIQRHVARWRTYLDSPPERQTQPLPHDPRSSEGASWVAFSNPSRREPPLLTRTLSQERRQMGSERPNVMVLQLATRLAMQKEQSRPQETRQLDYPPNLTSPTQRGEAIYSFNSSAGDEGYESMRRSITDSSSRTPSWIPRFYGRVSGFSTSNVPALADVLPGALERMGYRGTSSSARSLAAARR